MDKISFPDLWGPFRTNSTTLAVLLCLLGLYEAPKILYVLNVI